MNIFLNLLFLLFNFFEHGDGCAPTANTVEFEMTPGQIQTTSISTIAITTPFMSPQTSSTFSDIGRCQNQLPVRRQDSNSRPITQTNGINPTNSSPTLGINCSGRMPTSAVIITYYGPANDELGSAFGTGQITGIILECTMAGQWTTGNVTNISELECISS